ncbi:hypothetical protein N184_28930 [Sinorhizobium sp. GL28]|nr:hypothetical protein N184_28930 [Sinorhizobium sp. GL28]
MEIFHFFEMREALAGQLSYVFYCFDLDPALPN